MNYVSAIETVASQLSDIKSQVSDDQIVAKITQTLSLCGNRNSKSFKSAWNSTQDNLETLPLFVSRLQVEENMLKLVDSKLEHSDGAYYAGRKIEKQMHLILSQKILRLKAHIQNQYVNSFKNSIDDQLIERKIVGQKKLTCKEIRCRSCL